MQDENELDACGPVPHLEWIDHNPRNDTSLNKIPAVPGWGKVGISKPQPQLSRRFLYNTMIGEEYVNCKQALKAKFMFRL